MQCCISFPLSHTRLANYPGGEGIQAHAGYMVGVHVVLFVGAETLPQSAHHVAHVLIISDQLFESRSKSRVDGVAPSVTKQQSFFRIRRLDPMNKLRGQCYPGKGV